MRQRCSSLLGALHRSQRFTFSTGAAPTSEAGRIVRFRGKDGEERFGVFSDPQESKCFIAERVEGSPRLRVTKEEVEVDLILPPVDPPSIFCIGLNYIDHAKEVQKELPKFPIVFSKSFNTLTGHNSAIVIPRVASDPPEVDYEAELAVVIGRECKDVPPERALDFVAGYTIANDVTARRWQGKRGGGQWVRAKSFDTFLPLGPFLVPRREIDPRAGLKIRTWLNGDLVQDGTTADMIFDVPALISFLSQGTTLFPGTVILTGTPAGVGYTRGVFLKSGDTVRISIDGLGTLFNTVAAEWGEGVVEHGLPQALGGGGEDSTF